MDFYYATFSGNSARSAFALAEAGVAFSPHPFGSPNGENRQAPYLALNPMGKVPALADGDVRLWESNAINWYVAEKHPEARLLPASIAGRASVQRWLMFQAGHVSPACFALFRKTNQRVRAFWKVDFDPAAVETARRELARFLPVLDQALAGRAWLEGEFSLADVAYAPHFALLAEGSEGYDFAGFSNLRAWLERLWARPGWKRAVEMSLSGGA
jgi:glutathione S-transferase